MPEKFSPERTYLEQGCWALLKQRHPLTWWWWGPDRTASVALFPEWSRAAFEREAADWRRLAQESVPIQDPEVEHWGRFARWAATRILSRSYQDAAEPLRHANTALGVIELLDPSRELYPRAKLIDDLATWLSHIETVSARGVWRRIRMLAEASRLSAQLDGVNVPASADGGDHNANVERAKSAVEDYTKRTCEFQEEENDPIPWAISAHVVVESWREFRQRVTREKAIVVERPIPGASVLSPAGAGFPAIQEVVVPGLKQWWVRPEDGYDTIFRGDRQDSSLFLAVALAIWHQHSTKTPLTWALTQPPYIEGGLLLLAKDILPTLWPQWSPVKTRVLAQWTQRRRALAAADAWLWLEGAHHDHATAWLSRFFSKSQAASVIPWMKSQPGYYVMAHHVHDVLSDAGPSDDWNHKIFVMGPVMPKWLYVAPEQNEIAVQNVPPNRCT